jgi:hypothetical protein
MRAHETRDAGSDLPAKARAVEDAVVAHGRTFEVGFAARRNPDAQLQRRAALTRAGDIVHLALDRHERGTANGAEVDNATPRGHQPARQKMLDEHAVDGLQVEFRREIHHGEVLVIEFAMLGG